MPFDLFAPPMQPSLPSSRAVKSRTSTAQFGDGYGQRSEDGLNAAPRTFQAQWQALESADADSIEAFLEQHTSTPFIWTLPLEAKQRKWIAGDWSRGYVSDDAVSLSASLTEVFDL